MKIRGLLTLNDVDDVVDPTVVGDAISAFTSHGRTEVEQKMGKHGAEEGRRKKTTADRGNKSRTNKRQRWSVKEWRREEKSCCHGGGGRS
ncbi:hypothetical protein K0M31_014018 [Melipona bicolor]|uniref:Uncharacterized protein n=1 Tax=Melipona bicolor TaxID=60889 RepID=A0AA40G7R9_9HYME|nr:hypothetical protein K0M31_014018 [Melipona bicolor]